MVFVFFFKQKTAYEMRISDWSSDVCSSDLVGTQSTQVVASSVTGALAHWRNASIDFKMSGIMLVGGVFGSITGIYIFRLLTQIGQIGSAACRERGCQYV